MKISVRMHVPSAIFDFPKVVGEIKDTMSNKTAPEVKTMFRRTVFGWSNKPSFRHRRDDHADQISVRIFSAGQYSAQYALVNAGASPHPIYPRRARFLRFRPGYRASTRPRVLDSQRAYRSGPYISRSFVNHPGFRAREFDREIAEQYTPTFRKDMMNAMKQGIIHSI